MPRNFRFDPRQPLHGTAIFLCKSDPKGRVNVLGHSLEVHPQWPQRLVQIAGHYPVRSQT